jgi:hypothetical protein
MITSRRLNVEAIRATWRNGQIVPDGPVDLPEGCRLFVEVASTETEPIGVTEDDWFNTPKAIANWLTWYESLEPLEFTPEEKADLESWRRKVKAYTIANMDKVIEGLSE